MKELHQRNCRDWSFNQNSGSLLHNGPTQGPLYYTPSFTQAFFLHEVGTDNIISHTHRTINTHSPGSQSADTHQSYSMCVVWPRSTGTAEVRTRRWKQQENATLVPPLHQHRHSERDNTCPHMHKNRPQPTLSCSHAHNDTLTAELALVTHTNAQLSMCLYRLNRCNCWERWGCAPGTFAHPTHQSTFHTDCRVEELCTCACYVLFFLFFYASSILLRALTPSHWLKP